MSDETNKIPGITMCDGTLSCCCRKCVPERPIYGEALIADGRRVGARNRRLGCGRPESPKVFRNLDYGRAYLDGWDGGGS